MPNSNLALKHSSYDFLRPEGQDFQTRIGDYHHWIKERQDQGLYQYGRILTGKPTPQTGVVDAKGRRADSLNFSSQDYLSLSTHPEVLEAAIRAVRDFGVHSAGSPMIIGNTKHSVALEAELSEFLQMKHVLLYPTGWAAGFGAITGLVRTYDSIVMDRLSHACLQQGAVAATTRIFKHKHLDVNATEAMLKDIRSKDTKGAILVVSEGLFSMDADVPKLLRLQEVCHAYSATLLVDVAHDLGAMGKDGKGQIAVQGLLGQIDIVMGSFSKTFASNGGFVATQSPEIYEYLRMYSNPYMFSNALSPVQAAVVRKALEIIQSKEGDVRRKRLFSVVDALRERFLKHSIQCYGQASPIVPVPIGGEARARLVHKDLRQKNVAAMIIEFPIVPLGEARFRLQVMADHTVEQAVSVADTIARSLNRW